jgi:hypothetical protein
MQRIKQFLQGPVASWRRRPLLLRSHLLLPLLLLPPLLLLALSSGAALISRCVVCQYVGQQLLSLLPQLLRQRAA